MYVHLIVMHFTQTLHIYFPNCQKAVAQSTRMLSTEKTSASFKTNACWETRRRLPSISYTYRTKLSCPSETAGPTNDVYWRTLQEKKETYLQVRITPWNAPLYFMWRTKQKLWRYFWAFRLTVSTDLITCFWCDV